MFVNAFFSGSLLASDPDEKLKIVTTVSPITNIVKNIGGTHVHVTGIVPDGTDSHTFEPIPSDMKILQAADMIVMNGLDLELPTLILAEKVKKPRLRFCNWETAH